MLIGMAVVMPAQADKLDDIIASGKLRCAVVLDFPPMGSRDEKNQPIGYDVDTCNDLAAALGVKPEYVETPFPDRIPALTSGRADAIAFGRTFCCSMVRVPSSASQTCATICRPNPSSNEPAKISHCGG